MNRVWSSLDSVADIELFDHKQNNNEMISLQFSLNSEAIKLQDISIKYYLNLE